MSGRHSPPPTAIEQNTETLKGPKQKRSKGEKANKLQHFPGVELGSLTPPVTPLPSANAPETFSTPSASPPQNQNEIAPDPPLSPSGKDDSNNSGANVGNTPNQGVINVDGIEFHHASEAQFARMLSYYGIEWQYEPNQFPLRWHEGRPIEMFAPDFYLTEYDLYIELTTMRQSLVRRKNRKLRLLRALYPEINIKLIYRKDYDRLLERFGIQPEELEAEQPPDGESESED